MNQFSNCWQSKMRDASHSKKRYWFILSLVAFNIINNPHLRLRSLIGCWTNLLLSEFIYFEKMNCQRPIDTDRYRRLQDKGKVSPKVGTAAITSALSMKTSPLTPSTGHQRSMMPIANPYREAPDTPQLMSNFGCSRAILSGEKESSGTGDTSSNRQKQLAVSLFDEAKRQRYQKFRSRMRDSESPRNKPNDTTNTQSPQKDENQNTLGTQNMQQQCGKQRSDESQSEEVCNDKYSLKRVVSKEPPTDDKYALPHVRDFSQIRERTEPQDAPKAISPSKRSAFKTPKYYCRRQSPSTANKPGLNSLPSPPSITPSQQLSSHPMNSFGLPIAPARRDISTPQQTKYDKSNLSSMIKNDEVERALNTPSPKTSSRRLQGRGAGMQYGTSNANNSFEKPPHYASSGYDNLPLASSWRPKEQPSTVLHVGDRSSANKSKPPPASPMNTRKKPSLVVNIRSTPTSKPPAFAYSSSFDREVTPPPFPPLASNPKTPLSLEGSGSEGTSSTARKDRILEARGIQQEGGGPESREPLEEIQRVPTDRRSNIRDLSSPAPSLQFRPSLELPSFRSNFSSESRQGTPSRNEIDVSNSENIPRGVTPLDFYRRITAEKSRQVARAKQMSGSTPTKDSPSPSRISSPIFRADSPMSSSGPVLDQRTVRLLYAKEFNKLIREHVEFHTRDILHQYSKKKNGQRTSHGVVLFARKRPLLDYEAANGDFDVVNATTGQSNAIIVYVTSMLSDLQTKDIQAHFHEFDHVFSEAKLAEDIYIRMAQPEVIRARDGGAAAFIILGSKGSGKTHCMADIEERIAYDLFESSRGPRPGFVSVQCLELLGDKIVDLLGKLDSVVCITEELGRYRLRGSTQKSASCPRDLLSVMSEARRRLSRTSTKCREERQQGYILFHLSTDLQWTRGSLILLECPASELSCSHESRCMLNELMGRIRAKLEGRSKDSLYKGENNLTKIMQDVLETPKGKISVLATVSPAASRTEETISVLETLSSLVREKANKELIRNNRSPSPNKRADESPKSVDSTAELTLPRQWSHGELVEWMRRKHLLANPVPSDVDGRIAMRMTKRQLKGTFYEVTDDVKAERLYMTLRAENDRVARMRVKVRMARERQKSLLS